MVVLMDVMVAFVAVLVVAEVEDVDVVADELVVMVSVLVVVVLDTDDTVDELAVDVVVVDELCVDVVVGGSVVVVNTSSSHPGP